MRAARRCLLALWAMPVAFLTCTALAEPLPPAPGPLITEMEVGVFCALQAMDQRPAPGTLSGWVHVPEGEIIFHWPDRQVVPASLGVAFGVRSRMVSGSFAAYGEMRVYRPGSDKPEIWDSSFSDLDDSVVFFRFDHEAELVSGIWRFEAWDADVQLYSVEFEVVPAEAVREISQACGATS